MEFSTQYTILTIIISALLGFAVSAMADNRGRDGRIWFFLGFCFGLLALAALFILPNLANQEKEEGVEELLLSESAVEEAESKQWYYLEGEAAHIGPLKFEELHKLFQDKKISSTTYVWSEGMEEWKTVEECRLFTS